MSESRRRVTTLSIVAVVAVPLAIAATAFACARLATLKLDRATGRAGTEVTAIGRNFNSTANSSAIQLRFNGRNGRVLWEGRPNEKGQFRAKFDLPAARRGYYVILATQEMANGAPAPGTPGRAPIRMKKARRASSSVAVAPLPGGTGSGGPLGPATMPVGGIALLVTLLGGGAALAARRRNGAQTLTRLP